MTGRRRIAALVLCIGALFMLPREPERAPDPAAGRLPLSFEINRGQTDERVNFLARGGGYTLYLARAEAVLALGDDVVRMRPVDGNADAPCAGIEPQEARVHYFIGDDPSKWRTDVPTYGGVRYDGVYPGIDLVYHGEQGRLEYDFVVAPGTDPGAVAMTFEGAERMELDDDGDLLLHMPGGTLRQHAPVAYQVTGGRRRIVDCAFEQEGPSTVGFRVGAYDPNRTLVIDPVLAYSTYFGGSANDNADKILVDGAGFIYTICNTRSNNFPTASPIQASIGGSEDVAITKFAPDGQSLVFSTYLGGNGEDIGKGFGMDDAGNLYIAGGTHSSNFPTVNPYQTDQPTRDAFLTKIDGAGSTILFSTYLGGSGEDTASNVAVTGDGAVWITGQTRHSNFPTVNPLQAYGGGNDAFVSRFEANGTLGFSTFLGGSATEDGLGMALHPGGGVVVAGRTVSSDFPTTGGPAHQGGGHDAFVARYDGSDLLALSRLYGGSAEDLALSIAVDSQGDLAVCGYTWSTDLSTLNALQPAFGGGVVDVFVLKASGADLSPIFLTYLGGTGDDVSTGVAVDALDNVYLAAGAASANMPLVDPLQAVHGGNRDGYVAIVAPDGSSLKFATYLGGSAYDDALSVAVGGPGEFCVSGITSSTIFPTVDPIQANNAGAFDAFISKIEVDLNTPPSCTPSGAGVYECGVQDVVLGGTVADNEGDDVSYEWRDGTTVLASGVVTTTEGGDPVALPDLTLDLGVGVHTFELAVDDGVADEVVCEVVVEVVDTTAPTLAPRVRPGILWPPFHRMRRVKVWANASDQCDGALQLSVDVTSSEGTNHFEPDWRIVSIDQETGCIQLRLRAERHSARRPRIYTITITATDAAGNVSMAEVTVRVPRFIWRLRHRCGPFLWHDEDWGDDHDD